MCIYGKELTMTNQPIPEHHLKRLKLLGLYLKNLRINENMSLPEVGTQTKIHYSTIQRAESGANATLLSIMELADFYGIRLSELLSILD